MNSSDFGVKLPLKSLCDLNFWPITQSQFSTGVKYGLTGYVASNGNNTERNSTTLGSHWMLLRLTVLEVFSGDLRETQETYRKTIFAGALNKFFRLRSSLTMIALRRYAKENKLVYRGSVFLCYINAFSNEYHDHLNA